MLTYAALKFNCEPQNVYVIRASDHLYYNKRFFVGKVMGNARWSCRRGCRCGVDANDDFRAAEVLLMGNSRKTMITLVRQYHPDLTIVASSKALTKKTEKNTEREEKKRKRNELSQLESPKESKKVKNQDFEEVIIAVNDGVSSSKVEYFSFQDYNENSISDTRTVVNA